MIDEVALLSIATAEFASRLRLVSPDDWDQPTPCDGWDVRALANHVVGANRRHRMLLHGASAPAAAATRTVDHLGPDPIGAFAATAAELAAAFGEQGALDRTVHHPNGDRTGADLLGMRVLDLTVHAWDLARAIGAHENLQPVLVEYRLALLPKFEADWQQGGPPPPALESTAEMPPQTQLLELLDRQP